MERQSGVSPLSVPFSPWKDVERDGLFALAALRTLASPLLIGEMQKCSGLQLYVVRGMLGNVGLGDS